MKHEARIDQLRRIRTAEQRDPVDNAYFAFLALTNEQKLQLVDRYQSHTCDRDYTPHVKIAATMHNPKKTK